MIPRTIVGRIMPRFFLHSFINARTILNSKSKLTNQTYKTSNFSPKVIQFRLYTTSETNLEKMIADYEQVKKATSQDDILIVDVREPDEIKEHGKIPNSINIPLGNVSSVLGTMPEKEFIETYKRQKPNENTEIIFYCMIGKRSGMAQQNALNLGFKNVKNYLGSWTDWASKAQ